MINIAKLKEALLDESSALDPTAEDVLRGLASALGTAEEHPENEFYAVGKEKDNFNVVILGNLHIGLDRKTGSVCFTSREGVARVITASAFQRVVALLGAPNVPTSVSGNSLEEARRELEACKAIVKPFVDEAGMAAELMTRLSTALRLLEPV